MTAHAGAVCNSWYDYLTDFEGQQEDVACSHSLRISIFRVLRILHNIKHRYPDVPLLLGGISQGGCVALEAAATDPCDAVFTIVSHRISSRRHRRIACPCSCLVAMDDSVFPSSWARDCLPENCQVVEVHGDHWQENSAMVPFIENQIRSAMTRRQNAA